MLHYFIILLAALMMVGSAVLLYRLTVILQRLRLITVQHRNRRSRLATLVSGSEVLVWLYDTEAATFTQIAPDGKPRHIYSSTEMKTRYPHRDFEEMVEAIGKVERGEETSVTLQVHSKNNLNDQTLHEFTLVLSPMRQERGVVKTVLITSLDVTEETAAQRTIESKMMRYQSVFNTALVDMCYYDSEGYMTDANARAKRTFGITDEQLRNREINIADLLHGEYTAADAYDYHVSMLITDLDGREVWYELQLVPVRDDKGRLLCIYGSGRNIDETVRAWRELSNTGRQLEASNSEMKSYVSNINYVLHVGGVRIVNYSPHSHTFTIFSELDKVQTTLTQNRGMRLVAPESRRTAERMLNAMDNGTFHSIDGLVTTVLKHGGKPLVLQFNFIPTYDDSGAVDAYFGMVRDVSELTATQRLLEKETERAHEIEKLQNAFLHNMSYEIRTPLNAVMGFAELFDSEHDQEDEELFISQIRTNSEHLLRLINDILFLSRLDAHIIEINRQPIDFAMTFEGHCQMGWANNAKPGVEFIVDNSHDRLVVDIDDANFGRVIEQITANAARHTTAGRVSCHYDYVGNQLIVTISDTGVGIPQDVLEHVYDRFSDNNTKDTGLGLPICRELMVQMGGKMDIRSEVGKGTTVWLQLPCNAHDVKRKR